MGKPAALLPWFLAGFLGLVTINSIIELPAAVTGAALATSKALLLAAVIGAAINARPQVLLKQGWSCLLPVGAATLTSLLATLCFCLVFIAA